MTTELQGIKQNPALLPDDLRRISSAVNQLVQYNNQNPVPAISTFIETLLDDTSAAEARQTLLFPAQSASKRGAILVQNDADDGYEEITSQGSSGQTLTSNGADALPSFQTVSSGDWKLLSTQTASASATINFDSTLITSTYKNYVILIDDFVNATDDGSLTLRVSENNGSTIKNTAGDYIYAGNKTNSAGVNFGFGSTTQTSMFFENIAGSNASNFAINGEIMIFNPSGSGRYKYFKSCLSFHAGGSGLNLFQYAVAGGSYVATTNAINYIRLFSNSGNIASGTFKLYGIS